MGHPAIFCGCIQGPEGPCSLRLYILLLPPPRHTKADRPSAFVYHLKKPMPIKPKLGQNFLNDTEAIERIAASLGDLTGRTVVEIGPGRGAITGALAARAGHVLAVELDGVLAARLRGEFAPARVTVIEQNVLGFDFAAAREWVGRDKQASGAKAPVSEEANSYGLKPVPFKETRLPAGLKSSPNTRLDLSSDFAAVRAAQDESGEIATRLKSCPDTMPAERLLVVGNLPYNITSPILLKLAASWASLDRAVLMVQREVAERICAGPSSREYGLLAVTVQMYGPVVQLFTLPPSAFTPPPDVHSTVFRWRFAPRFEELGVEEAGFTRFLRMAFAQKRKTLGNNLRAAGMEAGVVESALAEAGVGGKARAEELGIEELAGLWRRFRALDL